MNNHVIRKMSALPIITKQVDRRDAQPKTPSFNDVLQKKISGNIAFSKHAVNRVVERNIDVSERNMERLNEGCKIAQGKGLNDTLILIDKTAFIVNIKSNTVITTISGEELNGNVFTNIDGTVII